MIIEHCLAWVNRSFNNNKNTQRHRCLCIEQKLHSRDESTNNGFDAIIEKLLDFIKLN